MNGLAGTNGLGCGSPPAPRIPTRPSPSECMMNGTTKPPGGCGNSPICLPVKREYAKTRPSSGSPMKITLSPAATPAGRNVKSMNSELIERSLTATFKSAVVEVTGSTAPETLGPVDGLEHAEREKHVNEHATHLSEFVGIAQSLPLLNTLRWIGEYVQGSLIITAAAQEPLLP